MIIIAPSLLAANLGRIENEVKRATNAGADWLHIDIMDSHFVPNLTFGPDIVKSIRRVSKIFLDVHLMCSRPEILIEPFAEAGADCLTIHTELGHRAVELLYKIKAIGLKAGIAINPPTSMDHIKPFLKAADLVLVMTVNPGYGGQPFMEETVPKILQVYQWREEIGFNYRIEVDGGININTVGECVKNGADTIVSGTGLFKQRNMKAAVKKMRQIALKYMNIVPSEKIRIRAKSAIKK